MGVFGISESVCGATNRCGSPVQDVGVDHCGAYVLVSEELLNGADFVTIFEEMGGIGVPERALAITHQFEASYADHRPRVKTTLSGVGLAAAGRAR